MKKEPSAEQIGWALEHASEEQLLNAAARKNSVVTQILKENREISIAFLVERLQTLSERLRAEERCRRDDNREKAVHISAMDQSLQEMGKRIDELTRRMDRTWDRLKERLGDKKDV